ncbi:hypothetical protein ACHAW6_001111 [Cyclotella cf. meneghiniana]
MARRECDVEDEVSGDRISTICGLDATSSTDGNQKEGVASTETVTDFVRRWEEAAERHSQSCSWHDVIDCCNKILQIPGQSKTNFNALYRIGIAYMTLGHGFEAFVNLVAARDIDPQHDGVNKRIQELKKDWKSAENSSNSCLWREDEAWNEGAMVSKKDEDDGICGRNSVCASESISSVKNSTDQASASGQWSECHRLNSAPVSSPLNPLRHASTFSKRQLSGGSIPETNSRKRITSTDTTLHHPAFAADTTSRTLGAQQLSDRFLDLRSNQLNDTRVWNVYGFQNSANEIVTCSNVRSFSESNDVNRDQSSSGNMNSIAVHAPSQSTDVTAMHRTSQTQSFSMHPICEETPRRASFPAFSHTQDEHQYECFEPNQSQLRQTSPMIFNPISSNNPVNNCFEAALEMKLNQQQQLTQLEQSHQQPIQMGLHQQQQSPQYRLQNEQQLQQLLYEPMHMGLHQQQEQSQLYHWHNLQQSHQSRHYPIQMGLQQQIKLHDSQNQQQVQQSNPMQMGVHQQPSLNVSEEDQELDREIQELEERLHLLKNLKRLRALKREHLFSNT